jgi:hypothetical protein
LDEPSRFTPTRIDLCSIQGVGAFDLNLMFPAFSPRFRRNSNPRHEVTPVKDGGYDETKFALLRLPDDFGRLQPGADG